MTDTVKFLGKRCKIFYNDGESGRDGKVQVRIGILTHEDDAYFYLDGSIRIPRFREVRTELCDDQEVPVR